MAKFPKYVCYRVDLHADGLDSDGHLQCTISMEKVNKMLMFDGLEKPTCCRECQVREEHNTVFGCSIECRVAGEINHQPDTLPPWCPAEAVEPVELIVSGLKKRSASELSALLTNAEKFGRMGGEENMSICKALFTSRSDEWSTPQDLFDRLDREFHFSLDAAANKDNAKCNRFFDRETDGLKQSWAGETVWCNPPYGKQIGLWMEKALMESRNPSTTIVMLVPVRTDTKWFHDYVYHRAEVRFLRGRLKFGGGYNMCALPLHGGHLSRA